MLYLTLTGFRDVCTAGSGKTLQKTILVEVRLLNSQNHASLLILSFVDGEHAKQFHNSLEFSS